MADFTNIDGVYAKDTELRQNINTLRSGIINETIKPLTITKNGTYTAIPSSGTYGYSPITVDVVEEPWQPLNDGYSNFWFELTNDTLSPWLRFSSKTSNATIDWGDGSGEVALDTLNPTHTYSKAGKYVVKVKGVTGIARQHAQSVANSDYLFVLKYVELNSDVVELASSSFQSCINLKAFACSEYLATINNAAFHACASLKEINLPNAVEAIPAQFCYLAFAIEKIVIGNNIRTIGSTAFAFCYSLKEMHIKTTTPPTITANAFASSNSSYVIYVPVGYGDTYKAASGWSTYADHIVEEGQSLSKSQLRAIVEEQKKSDNGEEMR